MKFFSSLLLIIGLILTSSGNIFCQKEVKSCDCEHIIDCTYMTFQPGDTINYQNTAYIPLNCNGDIALIEYYPSGKLFAKKYYKGIRKSEQLKLTDPDTYESKTEEICFFELSPTGKWEFFDESGKLIGVIQL